MLAEHSLRATFTLRSYFRICLSFKKMQVSITYFWLFIHSSKIKLFNQRVLKYLTQGPGNRLMRLATTEDISEQIHLLVSILRCKCVAMR